MKMSRLALPRWKITTRAMILCCCLLISLSAGAQELLKNGNFEAPFPGSDPKTNWTLVYVDGGPSDFAIAGQTTEASRLNGGRGAQIRASNFNYAHAYFKQVVTNLTAGASYTLNIQKMKTGFKYSENTPPTLKVYAAMISDSTSNAVSGNSTDVGPYSLVITAGPSRQIEVQLHMWKSYMSNENAEDAKHMKCVGWFDDFSLTMTP
jgi:hypothetical protein